MKYLLKFKGAILGIAVIKVAAVTKIKETDVSLIEKFLFPLMQKEGTHCGQASRLGTISRLAEKLPSPTPTSQSMELAQENCPSDRSRNHCHRRFPSLTNTCHRPPRPHPCHKIRRFPREVLYWIRHRQVAQFCLLPKKLQQTASAEPDGWRYRNRERYERNSSYNGSARTQGRIIPSKAMADEDKTDDTEGTGNGTKLDKDEVLGKVSHNTHLRGDRHRRMPNPHAWRTFAPRGWPPAAALFFRLIHVHYGGYIEEPPEAECKPNSMNFERAGILSLETARPIRTEGLPFFVLA